MGVFQAVEPAGDRLQPWRTTGIAWFKDTAGEHLRRIRELVTFLEVHGIQTGMLETDRPGYVVYEDEHQVVAEPFSDTGA